MACPHCSSSNFIVRNKKTKLGYQLYFCNNCNRQYNERTMSPFNLLQITTELLFEILILRLRYKVSLCDVADIYLARGICFSHTSLADWETKFYPLLADELQAIRKNEVTTRWKIDEVMVKVGKDWHYLYRGIDNEGKLVDVRLSKERDIEATSAYLEQAVATTQIKPTEITSDKNKTYPKAIKQVLGGKVKHRKSKFLNNKLEQDHRKIKQRYDVMLGFKKFANAARFCRAFEEVKEHFRWRRKHNDTRTAPLRRLNFDGQYERLKEKFCQLKLKWRQSVMLLS